MESYKLTYFNLRGIAEPIRLLFKYANVPFEDNQVDAKTWSDVQKDFKWQHLPILEYNGRTLSQSGAIGNFLAEKFGLSTGDPWNRAKCEEITGAVHDLRLSIKPYVLAKMAGSKNRAEELKTELCKSKVPLFLKNLNQLLEELMSKCDEHGKSSGLILGGQKPTWADFVLAHFTDQWTAVLEKPDLLDQYPLLKKQQDAVYRLAGVAEWIAERPQTFI